MKSGTKHIKKVVLIKTALGINTGNNDYFIEHIKNCASCSKKYENIRMLLAPSDNSEMAPSNNLESRILRSYREINRLNKAPSRVSGIRTGFLPGPVLAAAAAVVIIAGALLVKPFFMPDATAEIILTKFRGSVTADGRAALTGTKILSGGAVMTEKGSYAEIRFKDSFRIVLNEETLLRIIRAETGPRDTLIFDFHIERGSVYSKFIHGGKTAYSFTTPEAVVHSIGTEFVLGTSGKTTLILTEGNVRVRKKESPVDMDCGPEKKYIIDGSIKSAPLGRDDIMLVKAIRDSVPDDGLTIKDTGSGKGRGGDVPDRNRTEQRREIRAINRERRSEFREARKNSAEIKKQLRGIHQKNRKNQ